MTISSAPFPMKVAESQIPDGSAVKVCRDSSRSDFVFMMALDGFPPSLSCALEFQRMAQVFVAVDQQFTVVQLPCNPAGHMIKYRPRKSDTAGGTVDQSEATVTDGGPESRNAREQPSPPLPTRTSIEQASRWRRHFVYRTECLKTTWN